MNFQTIYDFVSTISVYVGNKVSEPRTFKKALKGPSEISGSTDFRKKMTKNRVLRSSKSEKNTMYDG